MQRFAVVIPKGVNIETVIRFAQFLDPSVKLDIEYLKYLINLVLSKMALRFEMEDKNVYIPIYSQSVRIRFSRHAQNIRALCERWFGNINILHRKPYTAGKSFSYAISPFYQNELLEVDYLTNTRMMKIARDESTKAHSVLTTISSRYHYLNKFFNPTSLQIDIGAAKILCDKRFSDHKSYHKYVSEMHQILELYNGTYRIYHNPDTDARLHTSITRLPRVYRQFVTFKGTKLVEIDLSNAVIYFIGTLLKELVNDNLLNSPLVYMFAQSGETLATKEVEQFWKIASEGEFYDAFIQEFLCCYKPHQLKAYYEKEHCETYEGTNQQIRMIVKKRIVAMLFAKVSRYKKEQRIFQKRFPSILSKILDFKTTHSHEKFSHLLFQIESSVMLGIVAKNFNKFYWRKTAIYTLHDCLITTADFKNELENLMRNEFIKLFGMPPKMQAKAWI
ncbi:MAG TPA: hypothetical protein VGB44_11840 [Flavobacterium sp.]|jgi:hypothetical protein